jgi:hypothetical protein
LIRRGLIDQDDLALALGLQGLDESNGHLGRILVELGAITEEILVAALAEQSGLLVADLNVTPDAELLASMSRELACRFGALPLTRCGDGVVVAVAEPPTREFRRDLSRQLHAHLEFVLATPDALHALIDRSLPPAIHVTGGDTGDALDVVPSTGTRFEPGPELVSRARTAHRTEHPTTKPQGAPNPIPMTRSASWDCAPDTPTTCTRDSVTDWLIRNASTAGATSVHLVSVPNGLRLRLRVDGEMRDELDIPEPAGALLLERIANAAGLFAADSKTIERGTIWSDDLGFGPELSVTSTPTLSGRYVVLHPAQDAQPAADHNMPELTEARHALATLLTETNRGVVLVACADQALRRAILGDFATDPMMQTRSVGCARLGTQRALQGVNQLDPLAELDAATLPRMARELDHDVVVVDVDDDDILRAAFNSGTEHALIIAGVDHQLAAETVADTCESVNPLLVATGLALVIIITENGDAEIITITPELKAAILDSPNNTELVNALPPKPTSGSATPIPPTT